MITTHYSIFGVSLVTARPNKADRDVQLVFSILFLFFTLGFYTWTRQHLLSQNKSYDIREW